MSAAQNPSCFQQKAEFHPTCSFVHCCKSCGLAGSVRALAKWLLGDSLSFTPHLELLARSRREGWHASRNECLGFSSACPSLCRCPSLAINYRRLLAGTAPAQSGIKPRQRLFHPKSPARGGVLWQQHPAWPPSWHPSNACVQSTVRDGRGGNRVLSDEKKRKKTKKPIAGEISRGGFKPRTLSSCYSLASSIQGWKPPHLPKKHKPSAEGSHGSEWASLLCCRGPGLCQQTRVFIWQKQVLPSSSLLKTPLRAPQPLLSVGSCNICIWDLIHRPSHHRPLSAPTCRAIINLDIKVPDVLNILNLCRIPTISHPDSDFGALIQHVHGSLCAVISAQPKPEVTTQMLHTRGLETKCCFPEEN